MYDKGDYARLREEMDIDWENEFKPCKNVENMRGTFIRKYENVVKLCIPKRKIGIRKNLKFHWTKNQGNNSEAKQTNGNSTIDYTILSMEVFPYVDDFYVDILYKYMSDVHCPICLVMLCKPTVSIRNDNFMHTDRKYVIDKRIIC